MQQTALEQSVMEFDRILTDKSYLNHMPLEEAERLLRKIQQFQQDAASASAESMTMPDNTLRTIIVAGCRLCSDLSEHLMMRAVDVLQDKQHSIDFLHQQLRKKIRDQHLANRVVQQAQSAKHLTNHTSVESGLGVIL